MVMTHDMFVLTVSMDGPFLPYSLLAFLPSFLPSFSPSFLPSFLPSSLLPSRQGVGSKPTHQTKTFQIAVLPIK